MRSICTCIVATFVLAGTTFADTIDVCPSCPYTSIQDAINDASDGDVIQIGAGTFNEYGISPKGKAIIIQGTGFGGTTIDAQQNGSVFVINSDEGPGTVINDLIIKGGSAGASGANSTSSGGGIFCDNVSAKITNCLITENTASDQGGGIIASYSDLTISGCTISNNEGTTQAGGMYSYFCNPTITDCIISGNTTSGDCGGYYIFGDGSSPSVTECTIQNNTAARDGGGIFLHNSSNPIITNCVISGNTAEFGGGIYGYNSSSGTIANCTITGNTASARGGGIYCYFGSHPAINDCTIENNTATFVGGGIFINDNCHPTVNGCTITGNTTTGIGTGLGGGGIMIGNACRPNITDCTISGNTTAGTPGGGGIYCVSSSPTIRNTTFDAADTIILDDESTLNPIGACCYDELCWSISEEECNDVSGSYTAELCSADTECPTSCSSDTNGDGTTDVHDLLKVIGAWGACH